MNLNYYKFKNIDLIGGTTKIVKIEDIKNLDFINWIYSKTNIFFNDIKKEYGGIINIDYFYCYNLLFSNYNNDDGMILWEATMVENMKPNQILWHTHNITRETKCEPPSGADIVVLINLAFIKDIYPIGIAIHNDGIWIYKLNDKFKEFVKKYKGNNQAIKEKNEWTKWVIDALGDLLCTIPNPRIKYHPDYLKEIDIREINNIQDYYEHIKRIFKDSIYIEFVAKPHTTNINI
jgi:hypothetical protein